MTNPMNMDQRIEAAAARLVELLQVTSETYVAEEMLRVAFPELFQDPPTAWIAPWQSTEDIRIAIASAVHEQPHGSDFDDAWNDSRDAFLNTKTGE